MDFANFLASFIIGFLSASYFASRGSDVAAVNDHLEDIKQIETLAVSYWLGENGTDRDACGHKLRGRLHASAVFRAKFAYVLGHKIEEYVNFEGQLFDFSTGGTFQTSDFRPDPATAVSVMRVSNDIRALLRGVRRQVYWAH